MNYLKVFRLILLSTAWFQWFWARHSPSIFPLIIWQEFLDIPYYAITKSVNYQVFISIALHHSFVACVYYSLYDTPFLIWHVISYMIHHTIKNYPYHIPYTKTVFAISWSTQYVIPSWYYQKHLGGVIESYATYLCYIIILVCYAMGICTLAVLLAQRLFSLTIFATWTRRGENFMQRIL